MSVIFDEVISFYNLLKIKQDLRRSKLMGASRVTLSLKNKWRHDLRSKSFVGEYRENCLQKIEMSFRGA